MKEEWKNPKGITPQKFETNDGSWCIEICDAGLFTLRTSDNEEWVFNDDELEIIIELLQAARQINPYQYETIIKKIETSAESPFKFMCEKCSTNFKTQQDADNCNHL